jgi:dATP pyrophosphohydrolase
MEQAGVPVHCRAVGVVVLAGTGTDAQVLLVKRGTGSFIGEWSLITGRIESEEPVWHAAAREVREEAGLVVARLYSAGYCESFYEPGGNTLEIVPMFVAAVDAPHAVTLNDENTAFTWVRIQEAIDLVPFHGHRIALTGIAHDFVARPAQEWRRIRQYVR